MESNCPILVKLVILQFVILQSFGFKRIITDKKAAEVRLKVHDAKQEYREKRSTNRLPDDIAFELPLESTDLSVVLHRNDHIGYQVPITVERSGKIINHNVNDKQDVGYYFDTVNGSSLMVQFSTQKDAENKLEFFGTIFHGSQAYLLQPPDDMHDTHSLLKIETTQTMEDATEEKIPKKQGRPKKRHYKHKKGGRRRHKQKTNASSDQLKIYEIEVLIVADFSVYSFWKEQETVWSEIQKDINAKKNIRQYYALMLNAIDLRFKSVTGRGYGIKVLFAGIHIADTASSSSWTGPYFYLPSSVDPFDALDSFETWLNNNRTIGLPGHDHAMLFTRHKLETYRLVYLGLVGEIGELCGTERVSIIQDDMQGLVSTVAAHELGHSLNAYHDGYLNNCTSDKYIMAPTIAVDSNITVNKGLWQFSRCSMDYFHEFIENLNRNDTNCMTARSASYNASALREYSNDLLGQMYPPDRQCEIISGTSTYMSRGYLYFDYTRICSLMPCFGTGGLSIHIPWEGTSCGNGKVCERGSCVFSPLAPTGLRDTCLFGDYPGNLKNYKTCHDIIITEARHYECYSNDGFCCAMCETIADIYKDIAGCTYGDRSPYCDASRCDSSSSHYRTFVCCSTCQLAVGVTLSTMSEPSVEIGVLSTKSPVQIKVPPSFTEMTSVRATMSLSSAEIAGPFSKSQIQSKTHSAFTATFVGPSSTPSTITTGCTYGDRSPYCDASRCDSSSSHYRTFVCCSTCQLAVGVTLSTMSEPSVEIGVLSTKSPVQIKVPPSFTEMTSVRATMSLSSAEIAGPSSKSQIQSKTHSAFTATFVGPSSTPSTITTGPVSCSRTASLQLSLLFLFLQCISCLLA